MDKQTPEQRKEAQRLASQKRRDKLKAEGKKADTRVNRKRDPVPITEARREYNRNYMRDYMREKRKREKED